MSKWILIAGGVLSGVAIVIGAFGAHALKDVLDTRQMGWIETGVSYHRTHALALICCGLLPYSNRTRLTAILLISGVIAFSGSLYLMALTANTWLGIVTPLGGVLLIGAWVSFCWAILKMPMNSK